MLRKPFNQITKQSTILVVALLYVVLSPSVAWPLYSRILFRPDRRIYDIDTQVKQIEETYNAKKRDVAFPSRNGKMIHGWYFELPKSSRVFLVSEGKGGSIYRRLNQARVLLKCGGSVLQYDYQGYGQSEGAPSLDGVCDDVTAAYDYLVQHEHSVCPNAVAVEKAARRWFP